MCVITRHLDRNLDDVLHIDRADPRILVAVEVIDEIRRGHNTPHVTIDGDLLKFRGTNRTVVYRIGEQAPNMHAYSAEWPD